MPYKDPTKAAAHKKMWRISHPDAYQAARKRELEKRKAEQAKRGKPNLKGVVLQGKKYMAKIQGRYLGMFESPIDAHQAYVKEEALLISEFGENWMHGRNSGQYKMGEDAPRSKLKNDDVIISRFLWSFGLFGSDLAMCLGVDKSVVQQAARGDTWTWLECPYDFKSDEFISFFIRYLDGHPIFRVRFFYKLIRFQAILLTPLIRRDGREVNYKTTYDAYRQAIEFGSRVRLRQGTGYSK